MRRVAKIRQKRETLWRRRYAPWIAAATLAALRRGVRPGLSCGGSGDRLTRIIAPRLSSALDRQDIVRNRGGAGGVTGMETVVKAPSDKYTLPAYGSVWIVHEFGDVSKECDATIAVRSRD